MASIDAALAYLNTGLAVVPCAMPSKRPMLPAWTEYQSRLPSREEVFKWFENNGCGVGLICGKVSGGLEVIDFDLKGEYFSAWEKALDDEGLLNRLVIERSQSGGYHVFYRCEVIEGNTKLAVKKIVTPDDKEIQVCGKAVKPRKLADGSYAAFPVSIETRGEKGFIVCAPTVKYEVIQGYLTQIPIITPDEREMLLTAARRLTEDVKQAPESRPEKQASGTPGKSPGEDFNERGDIVALLHVAGWKDCGRKGEWQNFIRPGKTRGISGGIAGDRVFHVFTSNAPPFEPSTSYSKFAVYAILKHNGDYSKAASALYKEGYGERKQPFGKKQKAIQTQPDIPPAEMLDVLDRVLDDAATGKRFDAGLPWEQTSRVVRGILSGCVFILCGAPGCTKSMAVLKCLRYWISKGVKCSALMLEDGRAFHLRRVFAQVVKDSDVLDDEWCKQNNERLNALRAQADAELFTIAPAIEEPPQEQDVTADYLIQWVEAKAIQGNRVIVIDPVTLMARGTRPWEDDFKFLSSAKRIIEKYESTLFLVSHPRRLPPGVKSHPTLDDLSGGICYSRAAQTIVMLRSCKVESEICHTEMGMIDAEVNRKLVVMKARNGSGSEWKTYGLHFHGKTFEMKEYGEIKGD